jgi:carbamoyl-phosphate synthase small subunit
VSDQALLVLEDGTVHRGEAFGARGRSLGEAVFTTGMTGYQETLTDPSYRRQIVVATAPHIGNTGWNDEDDESAHIQVAGYVVRDPARLPSNWRSRRGLGEELERQGVVGVAGVDTRAVTRRLRESGSMRAGLFSGDGLGSEAEMLDAVRGSPEMAGADLAGEVTTREPYTVPAQGERRFSVAALDLGIKANTPRLLAARGIETRVLPSTVTIEELLDGSPDGVFLSNGPGDPAAADHAVAPRCCAARCRCSASASATRSSGAPSGSAPSSCPTGTAGSTSPSSTSRRGPWPSPARTTGSRWQARRASTSTPRTGTSTCRTAARTTGSSRG